MAVEPTNTQPAVDPSASDAQVPATPILQRLTSVDAYRGFVMLLMMAEIMHLNRIAKAFPDNPVWRFLSAQQSHVEWRGCTLHDLIQPSFSFLVGVSVVLSLDMRRRRGDNPAKFITHAAWRALVLTFLGVWLRSLGKSQINFTFEDTLTQIGLGFFPLFLIALCAKRVWWICLAIILVGYWGAFALYPAPAPDFDYSKVGVPDTWNENSTGFSAHWNKNSNLAWKFDTWFLNLFPRPKPFEYNGGGYSTLNFIPTLATSLLGLIAGGWLLSAATASRKLALFATAGAICLIAGFALDYLGICPSVKRIWTTRTDETSISAEATEVRLAAFGFVDARRTAAALGELTRGLRRSSRLMQQMLPLLLDWLSLSPDPDLGLLLLRNLLTGPRQSRQIAETFRESPAAAQSLCIIAGTSRLLGDIIAANPDLVARLPLPEELVTKDRAGLIATATSSVELREGSTDQQASLRRWQQRNLLGIAARDVFAHDNVERVGHDLTTLAEATLESALQSLDPQIPFAVLGVGRFGGAELAYTSDLDLMFVHRGSSASDTDEARKIAKALMRMVAGSTPATRLYDVDCDLRPEGKNGPLTRGIDSYAIYWREHALTWERQAMTRARVVAGDQSLGDELLDEIEPWVWGGGLSAEGIREIRQMKARIEAERIPMGEDPDFHLKLGRGSLSDIEFTVQMLQLQYGVKATGTIDGLRALAEGDVLDSDDAEILNEAYEFCEQVRNRWFLVNSAPGDSMPTQPESALWLARSLDTEPGALREHYRRVTRRSRTVVERLFYGLPSKG